MFVKFTTLTSGKLACHTGCRSFSRYVPMTSRVSGFQELSSMVDGATSTGQARPGSHAGLASASYVKWKHFRADKFKTVEDAS